MMEPKAPRGPKPKLGGDLDVRDELADWLTRNNRQFARNMANRIWFHLLGRGVVDPVDDFRDSNPPANPALLDALTDQFLATGMRLRPLAALIMKSQTYQLGPQPDATSADDEANFARASVRLAAGGGPARRDRPGAGQARDVQQRPGRACAPSSCRAHGWGAISSRSSASPTAC